MITKINCRVELDHENWLPRENHSLIRLFFSGSPLKNFKAHCTDWTFKWRIRNTLIYIYCWVLMLALNHIRTYSINTRNIHEAAKHTSSEIK